MAPNNGIPPLRLEWLMRLYGMRAAVGAHGPSSTTLEWCPGDMTRYLLSLFPMVDVEPDGLRVGPSLGCPGAYAWAATRWSPGLYPGTMLLPYTTGYVFPGDVESKMAYSSQYTSQIVAIMINAALPCCDEKHASSLLADMHRFRCDIPGFREPDELAT